MFINSPVPSLAGSGCFREVCEESHCALQGWPGSAEPDGLHPKRGALANSTLLECMFLQLFHNTQAVCLMSFWLMWEFSTRQTMLHTVPILCGSPHVIPSAHIGTPLSPGFPMREAQSGRMYRIEQDHVSKYISAPPRSLFPLVQMLWVEQLHRLVLEPVL